MCSRSIYLLCAGLLAGCASIPDGPSVMALPGKSKTFDHFRVDDVSCRQYALQQTGGRTADQAAVSSTVRGAAVGTAIGAVAGAAIGGHNGAGVGAGTGLVAGTAAGAGSGSSSSYELQRRYDNAYVQCMYAAGEQVPVYGKFTSAPAQAATVPPSANTTPQ